MNTIAGYLFVTFSGEEEDGEKVYFSLSKDGFYWNDLNGERPVLCSKIGEKGVRDPFILRSEDKEKYYIIATDLRIASGISWEDAVRCGSRSVIIWESKDLSCWTEARKCEIAPAGAGCVWAPEAVYDHRNEAYMVFWASFVEGKHRIYRAYTKDFLVFTEPDIYMERDYDVIDMTIIREGEMFYRFYKNEISKRICMDYGNDLNGEFREIESLQLENMKGVEGPAVFPLRDGRWCLLADQFEVNGGYMPIICKDLQEGRFYSVDKEAYDMGRTCKRHGSVLTLSEEEYNLLEHKYGKK